MTDQHSTEFNACLSIELPRCSNIEQDGVIFNACLKLRRVSLTAISYVLLRMQRAPLKEW